jgi:hypothetical protein
VHQSPPHIIGRKAKTIDTRLDFTARLLTLILAQIYSAGAGFHVSIHLSVTS